MKNPRARRWALVAALVGTSVLLSYGTYRAACVAEDSRTQEGLERLADNLGSLLQFRLERYREILTFLRLEAENARDTEMRDLRLTAQRFLASHSDLQALEWTPRVMASERQAFERQVRSWSIGGYERYEIRDFLDQQTMVRAPERSEYWPITMLHPIAGNERALGFDVKLAATWETITDAARLGEMQCSAPIRLVQEQEGKTGVVMYAPVYRNQADALGRLSEAERLQACSGVVQAVLRAEAAIEATLPLRDLSGLNVAILDRADSRLDRRLFAIDAQGKVGSALSIDDMRGDYHVERQIDFGGRQWWILLKPEGGYLAARRSGSAGSTLAAGLAFSGLLGVLLVTRLRRERVVEALVERRTVELRQANEALVQKEARLEESRAEYRSLVENLPQYIFRKDLAGRFTFVNRQMAEGYGEAPEAMIGKTDIDYSEPALADKYRRDDQEVIDRGQRMEFVEENETPNGRFQMQVCKIPLRDTAGQVSGIQGIAWDITDRHRLQEAVRQSGQRFESLVNSLDCVVWEGDPKTFRFTFVSQQAERILGYPASEWLSDPDLWSRNIYDADRDRVVGACRKANDQGRDHELEYRMLAKDGRLVWLRDLVSVETGPDGQPARARGIMIDVTREREMEQRFQETQKLESLGVLAGGIAHDFNNLLASIMGNATLAQMSVEADTEVAESLHKIETTVKRAAELCRQMLAYAGKSRLEISPVDLNALVGDTVELLRASISKKTELQLDLEPGIPAIKGDKTQLRQIIMNLVINASEALEGASGTITLGTGARELDRTNLDKARLGETLQPGRYVCLRVQDTGCGMDEDTCRRLFEPFYTTKFTGRGLGLAAALGILKSHGGALNVESELGSGSSFHLILPPFDGVSAKAEVTEDDPLSWRALKGARALVVDDEDGVRDVVAKMLRRLGFDVSVASDGSEALEACERADADFDLILLDGMMPKLDGHEAAARIRDRWPDREMAILLMSGYDSELASKNPSGAESAISHYLEKPFSQPELARAVRAAMERTD